MKNFLHSPDAASKGAALMIVLAFVVLLAGVALAYSTVPTDKQLAHSSYNDTSADLLARSALDIVVGISSKRLSASGRLPAPIFSQRLIPYRPPSNIPNLIRCSSARFYPPPGVRLASALNVRLLRPILSITSARWNTHYLIPRGNPGDTSVNASPVPSFTSRPTGYW